MSKYPDIPDRTADNKPMGVKVNGYEWRRHTEKPRIEDRPLPAPDSTAIDSSGKKYKVNYGHQHQYTIPVEWVNPVDLIGQPVRVTKLRCNGCDNEIVRAANLPPPDTNEVIRKHG